MWEDHSYWGKPMHVGNQTLHTCKTPVWNGIWIGVHRGERPGTKPLSQPDQLLTSEQNHSVNLTSCWPVNKTTQSTWPVVDQWTKPLSQPDQLLTSETNHSQKSKLHSPMEKRQRKSKLHHFTRQNPMAKRQRKSKLHHFTRQNPMEKRQRKNYVRENPGNDSMQKPTQSGRDWKPNPCSALGMILTGS